MRTSHKQIPPLSIDALTPYFDRLCRLAGYGPAFRARVLEAGHIRDGDRILDVGCGTGTFILLAKRRYPRALVVGIEPDRRTLAIARRKVKTGGVPVPIIRAGAEQLPFKSASFDIVFSTLVFHHLPTAAKQQALAEIHRVLSGDGHFFLVDFGKSDGILSKLFDMLIRTLRLPEAKTMEDNVEGRLPMFLQKAGFQIDEALPRYRGVQFFRAIKTRSPG